MRSAKVVAGLEPENTNIFLIALAQCAAEGSYDSDRAVSLCHEGAVAGSVPPVLKGGGGGAEAKGGPGDFGGSSVSDAKGGPSPDDAGAKAINDFKQDIGDVGERGKSRGGTRGGKPQAQTADVGLGGFSAAPSSLNLDAEVERCDGSVEMTQTMLSSLIRKPKLTEKLLGKPPFRFLFDIVIEVRNATGFANGLFTEEEGSSANVTEKSQKMQFLDKIIMLVGVQLNTIVEARPAKIVAGLDPHLTNNFLQLLAVCAAHAPDSDQSVPTVLDKLGLQGGQMPSRGGGAPASDIPFGSSPQPSRESDAKEPFQQSPQPQSTAPAPAPAAQAKGEDPPRREVGAADSKATSGSGGGDDDAKRTGRPTTARRRPPKVKDGAKEVEKGPSPVKKASGILVDGADDEDEDDIPMEIDDRLADNVRSDDKAQGGNAESKLVRDILGRQAEQEAALAPDNSNPASLQADQKTDEPASKGGIRIGRLRKTGNDRKASGAGASGDAIKSNLGEGDLERLRSSIQVLVQHTGPLGGVLDFLQEDVGLMTTELRRWEEECRKYEAKLAVERDKSAEELQPLQAELAELDSQIAEKILLIGSTKANIARNDDKLMQLMKLMSSY